MFWFGNICKLMCQDADEIVNHDSIKYIERKAQDVGENVMKFYSKIAEAVVSPVMGPEISQEEDDTAVSPNFKSIVEHLLSEPVKILLVHEPDDSEDIVCGCGCESDLEDSVDIVCGCGCESDLEDSVDIVCGCGCESDLEDSVSNDSDFEESSDCDSRKSSAFEESDSETCASLSSTIKALTDDSDSGKSNASEESDPFEGSAFETCTSLSSTIKTLSDDSDSGKSNTSEENASEICASISSTIKTLSDDSDFGKNNGYADSDSEESDHFQRSVSESSGSLSSTIVRALFSLSDSGESDTFEGSASETSASLSSTIVRALFSVNASMEITGDMTSSATMAPSSSMELSGSSDYCRCEAIDLDKEAKNLPHQVGLEEGCVLVGYTPHDDTSYEAPKQTSYKDSIKYLERKVQNVGESVMKLYSKLAEVMVSHIMDPEINQEDDDTVVASNFKSSMGTDEHFDDTTDISEPVKNLLVHEPDYESEEESGSETSMESIPGDVASSALNVNETIPDGRYMLPNEAFAAYYNAINSTSDIVESSGPSKAKNLSHQVGLEESCVFVDYSTAHDDVSYEAPKQTSYKKKILDAFSSKKMLAREYEKLAILHATECCQGTSSSAAPHTVLLRDSQTIQLSDSEWELL